MYTLPFSQYNVYYLYYIHMSTSICTYSYYTFSFVSQNFREFEKRTRAKLTAAYIFFFSRFTRESVEQFQFTSFNCTLSRFFFFFSVVCP